MGVVAERMEPAVRWAAPEDPQGAAAGPVTLSASGVPVRHGTGSDPVGRAGASPSTGVAVARGDARTEPSAHGAVSAATSRRFLDRTHRVAGDDPASRLDANPLVQLGPVGPGAVLDGAFELLRFRFWRLVALCAAVVIPVQLLGLWLAIGTGADVAPDLPQLRLLDSSASTPFGPALGLLVAQACALFALGMAAGVLVNGWLEGRDISFGEVVRIVARRCWVVPIVVVAVGVAKWTAACLGFVGFFLVDALVFIAGPVAGAERVGPFAAIRRSVRLAKASYLNALAVSFGGFLITSTVRSALAVGPTALVQLLGLPEGWFLVLDQVGSLTLLITLPLTACIAARALVDLRCRAEGFDLVRRQDARGLRG